MNHNIRNLAKFGFYFTTGIYLFVPLALLLFQGGDALLPYEAALCVGLAMVHFKKALLYGNEALK